MWNARQSWDNHARRLAMSASKSRCFDVCTCESKDGHVSSWKSGDILDGPLVLAGPIDGKSLNKYPSLVMTKIDPIESLLMNDGRITPPNSFSESPSIHLAVHVDKKRQQTPATTGLRPSNPTYITPSPSHPNRKTRQNHPVRLEMSEMDADTYTLSAKLNYGTPKMSNGGVECVNDVDLEEYPQSNGCQYVASDVETEAMVSHT